jgi:16S rRNA processing protein RimM
VFSYTDPREAVLDYGQWLIRRSECWQAATLIEGRRHGKSVVARIEGFDEREAAAVLIGSDIGVPRERLPQAAEGQYYWRDLEGLKVVHRDGSVLGSVAYVMETGANDVLVTNGDKERLIPFIVDEVILDVDLVKGEISVDWEWD